MIRNVILFISMLAVAPIADAGVIVQTTTQRIDGFDVYTFRATSDMGEILGFNFGGSDTHDLDYGFFASPGSLNQINPFGLPTVFSENNGAITGVGEDVRLDSQFLFNGADTPRVTVPLGFASESDQRLAATFASGVPLGDSVAFARVAAPIGSCLFLQGEVLISDQPMEVPISGIFSCLPEPASLAGLSIAAFGLTLQRRRWGTQVRGASPCVA